MAVEPEIIEGDKEDKLQLELPDERTSQTASVKQMELLCNPLKILSGFTWKTELVFSHALTFSLDIQ